MHFLPLDLSQSWRWTWFLSISISVSFLRRFVHIPDSSPRKLQTIAQIRTVLAFVGESRALQAYSSALKVAQRLGYKSGFAKGMGLGATYFTVFCCYSLLLWYGGYLVRHGYTNGGLAMSTIFAVSIGCL